MPRLGVVFEEISLDRRKVVRMFAQTGSKEIH